jgi:DNA-binding response OmpR family regulator
MVSTVNTAGLIIVFDENAIPALARLAVRHDWPVLRMSTVVQAVPAIVRHRPGLVVVQVSLVPDQAVELIRLLRARLQPVPIIAVARSHDEQTERAIRGAGATYYLPAARDAGILEQVVASMLPDSVISDDPVSDAGRRL